jgi:competence protein ComEA
MVRTLCSIVAVAALLAAIPAAQGKSVQGAAKGDSKPAVVINLNSATQAELETLPGIGAKTAARIIEYRQKKGQFTKVEDLMNVQGIGEKSFLKLKPQITIGSAPVGTAPRQQ